jgi:hypothetical protein
MLGWLSRRLWHSDTDGLTEEEYGLLNIEHPEEDFQIKVPINVILLKSLRESVKFRTNRIAADELPK